MPQLRWSLAPFLAALPLLACTGETVMIQGSGGAIVAGSGGKGGTTLGSGGSGSGGATLGSGGSGTGGVGGTTLGSGGMGSGGVGGTILGSGGTGSGGSGSGGTPLGSGGTGSGGSGSGGTTLGSGGSGSGGSGSGGSGSGGATLGSGGAGSGGSGSGGSGSGGSGSGGATLGSGGAGSGGSGSGGSGSGGSGSGGSGSGGATLGSGGVNASAVVKATQTQQVIDGFGVSNAWLGLPSDATAKTAVVDALFSVTKGAGLSILRNRIPFRENPTNDDKFINKNGDGTYSYTTAGNGSKTFSLNWGNWDLGNTASLIAILRSSSDYQVSKLFSTPWTPPNNSVSKWKLVTTSTGKPNYTSTPEQGGYLDPNHYADYADVLADYVLGYKAKMGVDLTALSLQNEPSYQCSYESADWSAAQFHDFIAVLKTEFTKKGVFTSLPNLLIMAPEDPNVKEDLVLPTLADSNTASVLGVVGVHQYEFGTWNVGTYSPPLLSNSIAAGKHVWMTEFSTAAWATDATITDGLLVARLVHMDMTVAQMSAFLYWWGWGDGNGRLVQVSGTTVTTPKRLWAIGNFSRFVRPGWYRVATNTAPASNVLLSAYKNAAGNQIAVVAINRGTGTASFALTIDAGSFGTLTQYRTSATENLANVGTLTGGSSVNVSLPASSVTTLVGAWNR